MASPAGQAQGSGALNEAIGAAIALIQPIVFFALSY